MPINRGKDKEDVVCIYNGILFRKWQPIPVLSPGEFYGQRSQAGYSPWCHKELDMTEQLNMHHCCLMTKSCPTLLWPTGLQPTRLLCPWGFPRQEYWSVGSHLLLQGIFLTQELNLYLLHWQEPHIFVKQIHFVAHLKLTQCCKSIKPQWKFLKKCTNAVFVT